MVYELVSKECTGLENRQTLRACEFNVICKLKLIIGNKENLGNWKILGNLEIIWQSGKLNEYLKNL